MGPARRVKAEVTPAELDQVQHSVGDDVVRVQVLRLGSQREARCHHRRLDKRLTATATTR
jgi:hypothetical protein